MASNTKLLPGDKAQLRDFKKGMPKNMAFATSPCGRLTILLAKQTNCVQISTSVASPDEQKIRRKVGEWYALDRWLNGQYVAVPVPDFMDGDTPAELAEYFTSLLV